MIERITGMINFRSKIEIEDISVWMDGGSITLKCRNENDQYFEIEFVQNVSWSLYESQNIPGRIYLDKELINQRSNLETEIINGLIKAELKSRNSLDQRMLNEKLEYVSSEGYLTDQVKIRRVKRT
ncbi:hypothetical protein [Aquimarina macrocephali]|uniref:hypothetical protein n=1 Tax=Aquimarina macrocephali TaxID=666563 RepID=UPI003F66968A